MTDEEIARIVCETISEMTWDPGDPVTPDTALDETGLNLDELAFVEIAVALEDAFEIEVPDGVPEGWKKVSDAIAFCVAAWNHGRED